MITWGIIEILTGFVQNSTHLYIARFLLGIAEAGFLSWYHFIFYILV